MKKNWLVAIALGVLAAIVYFASVADYAFPGESAHLLALWAGLDVATAFDYPLLSFFAKLLGSGNLIAPVCGVVATVTLFHLVAAFVYWRTAGNLQHRSQRNLVALVAGAVAAFVFIFLPGVRSAASHVEPRLFDFTWAVLSCALVFPCRRFSRIGHWLFPLGLGVMLALGACDSVSFLLLLPLYVVMVVSVARRNGHRPYEPVFVLLVSALATFLGAMACFDLSLEGIASHASGELQGYVGSVGWVFVAVFTVLPFVATLLASGRAFGPQSFVTWLFHGTLTFISILSVATPLAPSALMEPYGVLPVLTCSFTAAVAGYLVAYWWVNRRHSTSLVVGMVLTFVLAVTSVWNLFSFDGAAGAFADKVAVKILQDLGSRHWFVSDGLLDDHLKLEAAKMRKSVNIISLNKDLDRNYLDRLSELVKRENVGGPKNAILRYSLALGVLPFVQDWFAADPSVTKDVAIFGAPDLWYSAGLNPVPEFFFFGADETVTPDWGAWKEFDSILKAPKGWGSYHDRKVTNPTDRLRYTLRRHLGFVANNRGVYLQDKGLDDDAFRMYELVLEEIDHDNICAIFNEVAMVGQKHPLAVAKKRELERMLKTAVEDKNRRYLLWRLGTYYGYIRNPDTFIQLGHAWARSGRPGDALSQVRRAIDFVPTDKRTILLNMMASLYASDNDQAKSRRIYGAILEKNANDHDALIGMMRLELMDGNSKSALEYLERATRNSGDGKRAKIELAMVAMMKNEFSKAKELLKKALDFDGNDLQAWSLLAAVTMQQVDAAKDEKTKAAFLKEIESDIIPAMEKRSQNQFDYYLQATRGFMLLRQGENSRREARDAFVTAAKARPDISSTQDLVLGLDISLDDKENAEKHAKEVLRRNRKAPLANYVMGSLALNSDRYDEAEMYLRRAADAPQPVALALNDLAEVLRREKKYDEAQKYARQATEKAPKLYVAWETLGSVLMDGGMDLDEAESCIRKACELSKDESGKEADIRMLVSLARVQIARGDKNRARLTIRKVRARVDELSAYERREFEKVVRDLE